MKVVVAVEEEEVLETVLLVDCRVIITLIVQRRIRSVLSVGILVTRRINARKELFASIAKKLVIRVTSARS
ncbi:hypothetical protein A2U01_0092684, partial [Trifolium medium]|nr:hypothetical protein [Trifolium medium]